MVLLGIKMITLAEIKDINELISLQISIQKECWLEDYKINDDKLADAYRYFYVQHLNKDCHVFVKKVENKIVAMSMLWIKDNLPYCMDISKKMGYITSVATYQEFRGNGFQHELMNVLLEYANKLKLKCIELDSENSEAIKIYKKFGFEVEDEGRIIMKKYLK